MNSNSTNTLRKNTISALFYQLVTIVCAFILPRLILKGYGSDVNGLINSISKFLIAISFVDFGIGAVVQSSLYKPLADNDLILVSKIVASGERYFKKMLVAIISYIVLICGLFILLFDKNYSIDYLIELVVVISIMSLSQYYFGVIDRALLNAAQMGYYQYIIHTLLLMISTFVSVILILNNYSIQVVKATTAMAFVIKPLLLRLIVNKKYRINRKIKYNGEPIKQKWNGVFQHIAAIINDQADVAILTIFATVKDVSVYSVYNMVAFGIKQVLFSTVNGIQALMGDLLARKEKKQIQCLFDKFECCAHLLTTAIYGCTADLILPFVLIYTNGITDTNYNNYPFAILITLANASHCLRLPYNVMILSAGHYKQTQINYIVATLLNILISIIMVERFGLVGVAIGTVVAMVYQTIWMAIYVYERILQRPLFLFIKQILVDLLIVSLGEIISFYIRHEKYSIAGFGLLLVLGIIKWGLLSITCGLIFYKNTLSSLVKKKQKICN